MECYQIKVYYGTNYQKCGTFFVSLGGLTYYKLLSTCCHYTATTSNVQSERYRSPVENLIRSKTANIKKEEDKIAAKYHEISALEESYSVKPLDTTRSACTKCHLRAGHTRANCVSEICASSRLCGDLKRHPEEKREIKNLKAELQLLKSKLN